MALYDASMDRPLYKLSIDIWVGYVNLLKKIFLHNIPNIRYQYHQIKYDIKVQSECSFL